MISLVVATPAPEAVLGVLVTMKIWRLGRDWPPGKSNNKMFANNTDKDNFLQGRAGRLPLLQQF